MFLFVVRILKFKFSSIQIIISFYPTAVKAVGVLFSPMVSRWVGGRAVGQADGRLEEVCTACISETVRCRKLILGRDIG